MIGNSRRNTRLACRMVIVKQQAELPRLEVRWKAELETRDGKKIKGSIEYVIDGDDEIRISWK